MKRFAAMLMFGCALCASAKDKKEEPPPEATKMEILQLELIEARAVPLQERLKALQDEYAAITKQIEDEHPGYAWNPRTQKLVKLPEAPSAAPVAPSPK
jgi:hypothetical protein